MWEQQRRLTNSGGQQSSGDKYERLIEDKIWDFRNKLELSRRARKKAAYRKTEDFVQKIRGMNTYRKLKLRQLQQ